MKLAKTCTAAVIAVGILLVPMVQAQAPAGQMDMKAMMKQNNEKMSGMSMTGKPDIDFAMMMREHHMGALTMAEWQLKNGKDTQMREMAKKIVTAQKKEIAQFDTFLAKNGHDNMKGSHSTMGKGGNSGSSK